MIDLANHLDAGPRLARLMQAWYVRLLEQAFLDAQHDGVAVVFDLELVAVQQVLDQLALQIQRVTETTRQEVRDLVARQAAEGWSAGQLAQQLQEAAITRSASRAATIARTESGTAYNLGALTAYRAAGLTHVDVLDGDDDESCASANGQRWTLDAAAANPLGHPNCTRAFAPVVEDA